MTKNISHPPNPTLTNLANQAFSQDTLLDVHPSSEPLPLVSVIIPAYNAEAFIAETLESVLTQTYRHIEVLVVDDGSQDRTAEIVRKFADKDARVSQIQQANAGVVASRNRAIQLAKGELIAPLDADDIWMVDNLEKQVNCIQHADASVGVVYAWSFDIDEQSQPTGKFHAFTIEGSVYGTLLCHCFLSNASSSLIRKTCFEKSGLYRTQKDLPQGCEDWDLYLRLAEFYEFKAVPSFLVGYRKHFNSMTNNAEVMARFLSLMWDSILDQYPKMPKLIYRISNANFFLYLGWQSDLLGQSESSLFWLRQSVKVGFFLPLVCPVFYIVLVKSLLCRWGLLSAQPNTPNPPSTAPRSIPVATPSGSLQAPDEQQWPVRMQTLMGNCLHWSISTFFGNPEPWKNAG